MVQLFSPLSLALFYSGKHIIRYRLGFHKVFDLFEMMTKGEIQTVTATTGSCSDNTFCSDNVVITTEEWNKKKSVVGIDKSYFFVFEQFQRSLDEKMNPEQTPMNSQVTAITIVKFISCRVTRAEERKTRNQMKKHWIGFCTRIYYQIRFETLVHRSFRKYCAYWVFSFFLRTRRRIPRVTQNRERVRNRRTAERKRIMSIM